MTTKQQNWEMNLLDCKNLFSVHKAKVYTKNLKHADEAKHRNEHAVGLRTSCV